MMEHGGGSLFCNSCVKVPVDPCSGYPTPSYERPRTADKDRRKIAFAMTDGASESSSPRENLDNFLEFLDSIPDYGQVHHLSNEQFKQKLEYLKRKQRLFLKSLQNISNKEDTPKEECGKVYTSRSRCDTERNGSSPEVASELKLNGKKCYLEESRVNSPLLFASGSFTGLTDDQDLITYRCQEKEEKTLRNEEEMLSAKERWYASKTDENDVDEESDESIETRSLPADHSKEWHPTVPKPFNFMLREEAEKFDKYTTFAEKEVVKRDEKAFQEDRRNPTRQRRVRPIPLTSKIPLYEKLLAEKEERSRIVREESAFNLMSQVRPFKLECDRRAWKSMSRSSPVICSAASSTSMSRFRAKPVPKNLFTTDVYDRMLEDEYFRQVKKRVRAAELMKSSSLPPSMAVRERIKSATTKRRTTREILADDTDSSSLSNHLPPSSDRSRSATNLLPSGGSNLAAILRCQVSRQKLEQEMREKMEEKRREQEMKLRENLIGRKPAWRALRSAARHEHERDLDIRASLRRDEAREQAERHRLQMEMMWDRVTQIPTLFERHSQSFQSAKEDRTKSLGKLVQRKGKKKVKRRNGSSADSYTSYGSGSRPDSGSLTSSTENSPSFERSSKSSSSKESGRSLSKSGSSSSKKKSDRRPLKVSINETAELIEDRSRETDEIPAAKE